MAKKKAANPEEAHAAVRLEEAKATLQAAVGAEPPDAEALNAAVQHATEAGATDDDVAPAKAKLVELTKAAKAVSDAALKKLRTAMAKADVLQIDVGAFSMYVSDAEAAGVDEEAIKIARAKITNAEAFFLKLRNGAEALTAAIDAPALDLVPQKLEQALASVASGAQFELKKAVALQKLSVIAGVRALDIAVPDLQAAVEEATEVGLAADTLAAFGKKATEAKEAQDKQAAADKKAKKKKRPPNAAPKIPAPSPKVNNLQQALEQAVTAAEAKLLECQAVHALVKAAAPELLTGEKLLDFGERALEEVHPAIAELQTALQDAEAASVVAEQVERGKKALEAAEKNRADARRAAAETALRKAGAAAPLDTDVVALRASHETAAKESVKADVMATYLAKLNEAHKLQAEAVLEPMVVPMASDEVHIIEPLGAALAEATKWNAKEDLLIKAQTKLEFWKEALERRGDGKSKLEQLLKPTPVDRDAAAIEAALKTATDEKVAPEFIASCRAQLEVTIVAQRLHAAALPPAQEVDISLLEHELSGVGGVSLQEEEARQRECDARVKELEYNIAVLRETKESQASRDAKLKGQIKGQGKLGQSATPLKQTPSTTPAWVKWKKADSPRAKRDDYLTSKDVVQDKAEKDLEADLAQAQQELEQQSGRVAAMAGQIEVPQDLVKSSQAKLVAAKANAVVEAAGAPELQNISTAALQKALKGAEVAGVPNEALQRWRTRLVDAEKEQSKRSKATARIQMYMDSDMFEEILDNIEEMASTSAYGQLEAKVREARRDGVAEDIMADAVEALKKMQAVRRFEGAKHEEKNKSKLPSFLGGAASFLESNRPERRKVDVVASGERRGSVGSSVGGGSKPARDPQFTQQLQQRCLERLRFAMKDGMTTYKELNDLVKDARRYGVSGGVMRDAQARLDQMEAFVRREQIAAQEQTWRDVHGFLLERVPCFLPVYERFMPPHLLVDSGRYEWKPEGC